MVANYAGYASLVRGAASGNDDLRAIYEEARAVLTDRIFEASSDRDGGARLLDALGIGDTPATRLMVRGWSAMTEDVVLAWVRDPRDVDKRELLALLAAALVGVLSGT